LEYEHFPDPDRLALESLQHVLASKEPRLRTVGRPDGTLECGGRKIVHHSLGSTLGSSNGKNGPAAHSGEAAGGVEATLKADPCARSGAVHAARMQTPALHHLVVPADAQLQPSRPGPGPRALRDPDTSGELRSSMKSMTWVNAVPKRRTGRFYGNRGLRLPLACSIEYRKRTSQSPQT